MKTLVCGSTKLHAETGLHPLAESIGRHWGCWKNSKSPCLHFPGIKGLIILVVDIVWCSCCLMAGHSIHKSFQIIRILEVKRSFGMGFARGIPWLKHRSNTWIYSSWNVVGCFQPSNHKWYMCGKFAWAPNAPCNKSSFCNSDSRPHSSTWTRGTKEPILSDSARQQRTSQNPFDISNWG